MDRHRYLLADADLDIVHASGSRIRLALKAGQGVMELSDPGLLRWFLKQAILHRQYRATLQQLLAQGRHFQTALDINVAGKPIARIDTRTPGGFICRALGLTGCQLRPARLILTLFKTIRSAER